MGQKEEEYTQRKNAAIKAVEELALTDTNVAKAYDKRDEIYVELKTACDLHEWPLYSKVVEMLKERGFEIGGYLNGFDNPEWRPARDAMWAEHEKTKPEDPSKNHSRSWVYTKNGKAAMTEYQGKLLNWQADWQEEQKSLPPYKLPGFHFNIQSYGTNEDIFNFYKDCKYWGD